ncbi:MAG: hypothetical protein FWE11_05910 [Defluviitaleaceae bacterium]|nr:hypothetical protein [Defluviitaleaceae bacterium]
MNTWRRHGIFGGRFAWPVARWPIGEEFEFSPLHYRFNRFFRRRRFW